MHCASCGSSWIENAPLAIVDITAREVSDVNVPAVIDYDAPAEREIERLVEASRVAREEFAARRQARIRRLRGWAALAAVALLPVAVAAAYPENVVRVAPVTAHLYEKAGFKINIYGIEIRNVEQQNLLVDGQRMLAVKGVLINVSNDDRKVPSLRFGLMDDSGKEVYNWTTTSGTRPLRPGEVNNFVTRISAPPENGQKLQIRFARMDEIGSNTIP